MIRNYFFDLGGVLMDLDIKGSLQRFAQLVEPHSNGNDIVPEDLLGVGENALIQAYQVGSISTGDFIDALKRYCRPEVSESTLIEAWDSMLKGIPIQRVDALRKLHNTGGRIFILSNINEEHLRWSRKHFEEVGLRVGQEIEAAYFSNEIGMAKPDPHIYQYAIEHSGVRPDETLYIDDMAVNIEAGAKQGLQTMCAKGDEWISTILPNGRTQ